MIASILYLSSLLCHVIIETDAKKILFLMAQSKSHMLPAIPVAEEMVKLNHTTTFVVAARMKEALESEGIKLSPSIIAKSFDNYYYEDIIRVTLVRMAQGSKIESQVKWLQGTNALCHEFMNDKKLINKLKDRKFDIAVVDYAPVLCFTIMAYKLDLPFVSFGAFIDPTLNRVPLNPAFTPTSFSAFNDKMTFLESVWNTLRYLLLVAARPAAPTLENLAVKYVPEKPAISNQEAKQKAMLYIHDSDILFDYPQLFPPNVILCGGLAAHPSKKVSKNLDTFASSNKGLVVVSFGSIFKTFPNNTFGKMIEAFKQISDLNFVIRQGDTEETTDNILRLPWIPQNDLLGHPRTVLFITHCGRSGSMEAIYHRIPVIKVPLSIDQPYNAGVMEDKGYGIKMDLHDFSTEELIANIRQVAFTDKFKRNIKQASDIFHSRPQTPAERAAYYIDLVAKHGDKHFRHFGLDMPWYSFYLFEVMCFLLLMSIISSIVMYLVFRKCRKYSKNRTVKHKKE
ncbi:UDP-glucuronosyltransferase 2A3-like [Mytilus californianus]|uniref:UDP-glucuronosyltransferase 2A3-like n=1 Tax=Mytilus californianus TaxID=6549 RepID=UPI0022472744|nr:UDP-glucuronosyltransferase 2A3-like [Mytilus californianus]XP_052076289.1 UDP-glucuronosyltransferase 2A3-like [Mytilus californianus]